MKIFALLPGLAVCFILPAQAQIDKERFAIESVTQEYLQAWYEGNDQLMATVVHPQMAKKIVFDTGNKNGALAYLSVEDLLAQTKKKRAQKVNPQDLIRSITILDIYNNVAIVKAETPNWIDYLHMAKISGKWKIVNILWELKSEGL